MIPLSTGRYLNRNLDQLLVQRERTDLWMVASLCFTSFVDFASESSERWCEPPKLPNAAGQDLDRVDESRTQEDLYNAEEHLLLLPGAIHFTAGHCVHTSQFLHLRSVSA